MIPLTRGYVAIVDDEDYARLAPYRWKPLIRSNGRVYAIRRVWRDGKQRTVYMHRVVLDAPSGVRVDHRNRDGPDNRHTNLRLATPSQNQANAIRRSSNVSGYKGVSWHAQRSKWVASVTQDSVARHLGLFDTAEDAAHAYDAAARRLFGEFARPNGEANPRGGQ